LLQHLRGVGLAAIGLLLLACAPAASSPAAAPPKSAEAGPATSPAAKPAEAPAAQPAAPAASQPLKQIKVSALSDSIDYSPHRIATLQGFHKEEGLEVEVVLMPGSTAMAALVSGEIDLADATGTAVRAAATGLPVRLAECHGIRPGYLVILGKGV